ncbi:Crp/Fnr family transcriptional regulator [Amylibacter sp. SFDW26]|uniref:Crp/Fnr family transcriptional regulator n=1 Tax=Amylibacter sp. SFDW26 TaxID=2652722 RepID=UPI001262551C|nr:Crp/Fnr family transcriptional regulator [Amylibacter sp. SFDW26]KAB7614370.1 Crp/Fnr family transcriptional regulator [Amylibacter sp. SFDW26]
MLRNKHTFKPNSFLGSISQESWDVLSAHWTTHTYQSGQFLISADDEHTDIFFILSGAAKVTIYTPAGREVSFAAITAGDSFGEYAAIDNAPRSSSVVASGDCIAASLGSDQFRNLLLSNSDISFALHKVMVAQLRKLSKRVIDFNAKSADMRLQETLLELANTQAHEQDAVLIERPPTQSELAAYIFSSREGVAREMGRLRKAGIIERQKRSLYIPSVKKLQNLIDENS